MRARPPAPGHAAAPEWGPAPALGLGPALALALAAAACTQPARTAPPLEAVPASFHASGEQEAPARWWTSFDDPGLDRTVERALQSNLLLESAWQRLRQARAIAARESSFLWPDLEAQLDAESRRPATGDGDTLLLGLSSVYEVDLWGRIRAAVEADRLRARATAADYRAAAVSLSAEVARVWYRRVEAHARRGLLREQIATNERVLESIEARVGNGLVRGVDLLRQQQLVEATRARLAAEEARVATLENLLAVLLGRAPQQGLDEAPPEALPPLPPLPATGIPAGLVRRRPDVQRAFLLLQAADHEVAAAVSARYPRLALSASLTTADDGAEQLFDEWTRSFAGSLVAPLFDAGRRRAEVDRAEALAAQRLQEYGQAILVAFREVEDALVQEQRQRERIDRIGGQVRLAERTHQRLLSDYFDGAADYIDVLTTLTELQELRRDLISARMLLLEFRIALYRALAGGFETQREAAS